LLLLLPFPLLLRRLLAFFLSLSACFRWLDLVSTVVDVDVVVFVVRAGLVECDEWDPHDSLVSMPMLLLLLLLEVSPFPYCKDKLELLLEDVDVFQLFCRVPELVRCNRDIF
jgi:hypothetical protein